MIETYVRAYVDQVRAFAAHGDDQGFALTLDNTDGHARQVLVSAVSSTRIGLLEDKTVVERHERRFRAGPGVRRLDKQERAKVERAYEGRRLESSQGRRRDGRAVADAGPRGAAAAGRAAGDRGCGADDLIERDRAHGRLSLEGVPA
ncbi:hypothetical protein GCM10022214_05120 [Actinomadura miaoliensis]|uniref:DUF222 domain-containing protein n=2 Tax=Actinomadura miaoliensis TaxID=430685 RepID=A0ABP7UZS6_9ACTN